MSYLVALKQDEGTGLRLLLRAGSITHRVACLCVRLIWRLCKAVKPLLISVFLYYYF